MSGSLCSRLLVRLPTKRRTEEFLNVKINSVWTICFAVYSARTAKLRFRVIMQIFRRVISLNLRKNLE